MALKAILGSKLGLAAMVVVVLGGVVGATATMGVFGTPQIESVNNSFGDVNETTTTIETELIVNNPNPIGADLGSVSVDYGIRMNDLPMANGSKKGITVGEGNTTLPFTTRMANEQIPAWWVTHVQNDENTTLRIDASVRSSTLGRTFEAPPITKQINTNIIGAFNSTETRDLNANKEPIVQDPVLYLNSTSGSWGAVTQERTEIDMQFTLYNPKSYPIRVSEIGYDIRMNNLSVGSGQTSHAYTLPPHETTTVEATTVIDTQKLDEWWVSHLQRNQQTELEIDLYMRFDLSSGGGGSVKIPLETLTKTVETDFFGNKTNGGSGNSTSTPSDDASTPTATETASDDGQTATETPTDEQTVTETTTSEETTATETETTTSDGSILG